MAIALSADVYYPERVLVRELGVSKAWLRGTVGGLQAGNRRVYRGARVLECLADRPPTASASTSGLARHSGGRGAISQARPEGSGGGPPASRSSHARASQRERLAEWRRTAPNVSPLKPTG